MRQISLAATYTSQLLFSDLIRQQTFLINVYWVEPMSSWLKVVWYIPKVQDYLECLKYSLHINTSESVFYQHSKLFLRQSSFHQPLVPILKTWNFLVLSLKFLMHKQRRLKFIFSLSSAKIRHIVKDQFQGYKNFCTAVITIEKRIFSSI